jgi:hypothetical protein
LHAQGIHLISTDEKPGIQALERKYPTKPMKPGLLERVEFEYIRHGTQKRILQHTLLEQLLLIRMANGYL